jgi:ribosomal protein S27AE
MPVNLYYTQRVRRFQQESIKYSKESVEIRLKRTKQQCPHCGSTSVTVEPLRSRRIRGEPLGNCRQVVLELTIHRLYCSRCHFRSLEHISFLSHPKARLTTKARERTILALHPHMSIQALTSFYKLRWHTIK